MPGSIEGAAQPAQIVLQRLIVRIRGVFFDGGYDGGGIDEPGQIIDVAVGVVAHNALTEPEHADDAEVIAKILFDLLSLEMRIAVGIQQT